jgi:dihydrofolate reductase
MNNRKVVLYISMSLDGFITTNDDDLSWLSLVAQEGEDYGYGLMQKRCDTYIVGRKTYEVVLSLTGGEFPQAEMYKCFVITRQERANEKGIQFYNGSIKNLISDLKGKEGKDIYCDGGGQIVELLMDENLIDEYIISVIPTILGDGKRLFNGGVKAIDIDLKSSQQYESGLVQLLYTKKQINP